MKLTITKQELLFITPSIAYDKFFGYAYFFFLKWRIVVSWKK